MSGQERLHALDAVRAFALLLGIVLHATMSFFLPIPAHDVSQSATLSAVFFVIHTFRMTMFFVVAGLFARLVVEKRGERGFIRDRSKRILGPMIVGWLVFAPPTIAALIWGVSRTADPATRELLTAGAGEGGAGAFPLTHLWFLYYLCVFYVLVLAVRALVMKVDAAGRAARALDMGVRVLLRGYAAPFVLALPLYAVIGVDQLIQLGGIPTPDQSLIPQLPALAGFGTAFVLGWFVHRDLGLLHEWRKRWVGHLAVGVVLTIVCLALQGGNMTASWLFADAERNKLVYAVCYMLSIWYWSFGIIGAALEFCANESPVRRYLADSSYWLYLAHLPLVFFLAAAFATVPWHWAIKFPLILAISLTVLLASYHYLVRPTWIGEILNGRRYPRAKRAPGGDPSAPNGGPGGDPGAPKRGPKRLLPGQGAALSVVPPSGTLAPAAADVVAELVGVHKRYGNLTALAGLTLDVRRGELLAVLGPNGAGKSTAISLWLGLTQPTEGEVRLMGGSPLDVESRREVGVMMQEVALPVTLRARDLIDLTASYYQSPFSVSETLELTRTTALANRPCGKLSAGQKRQVQFALAVCGRPRLLFLDEPTVGLDIEAREAMWGTIRELVAQRCSIVLTTHYLEEAESLATRVAVLARGELIASGTVEEVRSIVSRKRITCSSSLPVEQIRAWPGVVEAAAATNRLQITTADAEGVVRRLLAADHTLRNLEVRQAGLAEAFAELTKEAA